MKEYYYKVGGHSLAVIFVDEENDEKLIPSFAPFRLEEKPEDLLFTMTVDDNLEWEQDGEEIGVFDCGGCDHGVYRMPDGGYQYSIHDVSNVLCSRMRSNADFSVSKVSLYGETWPQRNYGLNNALMMAYAFAAAQMGTMLMHASVIRCDGKGYLIVGDTDAHGAAPLEGLGQLRQCGEDESEGTRKVILHQTELSVIKLGILCHLTDVAANYRQIGLCRFHRLQGADALYRLIVKSVATNGIDCVCWIYYYSAITQH